MHVLGKLEKIIDPQRKAHAYIILPRDSGERGTTLRSRVVEGAPAVKK